MTPPSKTTYKRSSEYELPNHSPEKAFLITLREWNFIENRVKESNVTRWFFSAVASCLWGTAATEFVSMIVRGKYPQIEVIVAVGAFVIGVLAWVFSKTQKENDDKVKQNVVDYMKIIREGNYPSNAGEHPPRQQTAVQENSGSN